MANTIFACATAVGKAGVAIIRVSGPDAFLACHALTGYLPSQRGMRLVQIRDFEGDLVDEALVLSFLEIASFTGEKVVEFHTHGSPQVIHDVLELLNSLSALRLAEVGEFTRRALLNNRLDLAEVEGLSELLNAETKQQRKQAIRLFQGEFSQKSEVWRQKLIRAMSLIEAVLDFADEDVPEDVTPEVLSILSSLTDDFSNEINGSYTAERLRNGFEVAIIGAPNSGKSTLLNYIAKRPAAITSEYAGTTRDIIEVKMDIDGIPITFLDTAGLRDTSDSVEKMGIEIAISRAMKADLRVFLLESYDQGLQILPTENDIIKLTKADLRSEEKQKAISGTTGYGIDRLLREIADILSDKVQHIQLATNIRHRNILEKSLTSIEDAKSLIYTDLDLAAEELRRAVYHISALTGHIGVEDLLTEIFSSFCLGK